MDKSLGSLKEQLEILRLVIRERDAFTAQHCDRTCELAVALAQHCALSSRELDLLRLACPLHDIGKLGIPDRILLKPGKLDALEWQIMQTHSERGYQLLSSIDDADALELATIIRHHHEGFDGLGYPAGLAGDNIPLLSRILALADSYDAMASRRSYHAPLSHAHIMTTLFEEDGGKFDPVLRNRFASFIEASPYRADRWVSHGALH